MMFMSQYLMQYYKKWRGDRGVGTLEIILIIFVLIGFVLLFRTKMLELITHYLEQMDPKIQR